MTGLWSRTLLFWGEGANLVQNQFNQILYVGGFTGSQYNNKIGTFVLDQFGVSYTGMHERMSKNEDELN